MQKYHFTMVKRKFHHGKQQFTMVKWDIFCKGLKSDISVLKSFCVSVILILTLKSYLCVGVKPGVMQTPTKL
jgi:hypothetical protein